MTIRKIISAVLLSGGAVAASVAQADIYVYDGTNFPGRLIDVVPSHQYSYMAQPGYYSWDGTRYVWSGDTLVAPGFQRWAYVPGSSGIPEIGSAPHTFLRPGDAPEQGIG
jgi:hypothetical protein